jgi:hypothetical protein
MTDVEIEETAREFVAGVLDGHPAHGMCWMVSSALQAYLEASGVPCALVHGSVCTSPRAPGGIEYLDIEGWGHYWVRLADGRIIDGTASQFNGYGCPRMPGFYFGAQPEHYEQRPDDEDTADYRAIFKALDAPKLDG